MKCLLDDLEAFGINADHYTTAAQGEGEWRRRNKGRTISRRNELLRRKPGLDYGIQ